MPARRPSSSYYKPLDFEMPSWAAPRKEVSYLESKDKWRVERARALKEAQMIEAENRRQQKAELADRIESGELSTKDAIEIASRIDLKGGDSGPMVKFEDDEYTKDRNKERDDLLFNKYLEQMAEKDQERASQEHQERYGEERDFSAYKPKPKYVNHSKYSDLISIDADGKMKVEKYGKEKPTKKTISPKTMVAIDGSKAFVARTKEDEADLREKNFISMDEFQKLNQLNPDTKVPGVSRYMPEYSSPDDYKTETPPPASTGKKKKLRRVFMGHK